MKRTMLRLILLTAALMIASVCLADEEIWAEVNGYNVDLFHTEAYYNCCWLLDAELTIEGSVIDLYETRGEESLDCYCFCYFDLNFSFELSEPGDYLLRVWYLRTYDGSNEYELRAELPIVIEDEGGEFGLVDLAQSPCGGWDYTAVPETPEPTSHDWSMIKALY